MSIIHTIDLDQIKDAKR